MKFIKKNWKLLFGFVAIVGMAIFFMRGNKLEELVKAIKEGYPYLLILAFISQMAKYFLQAESFVWCFKAVKAELPYKVNVGLVFKTFFLDTIIPSFNISGTSIAIKEASEHGIVDGKSTGAALLRQISISAAFVLIMLAGFITLLALGKLQIGYIIIGGATTLSVGALIVGMLLAALKPDWVLKVAAPIEKPIDKILAYLHKKPIDAPLKNLVETYAASAKMMVSNKRDILIEYLYAVIANLFELGCFTLICFAFNVTDMHIALCVYVLASIAALASPIPQGVGVVEAASLVAFTLFGVGQATGMAIILIYRLVSFWIPFLVGAFMMQGKSS